MKKIFKGIAILAATAAVGTGVAFATGCGGTDGEYIGHYCYANEYNAAYGMVVKVTVKDNIIQKVEDVTNTYGDGKAFSFTYYPVVIGTDYKPTYDEHGNIVRSTTLSEPVYNKDWHTVSIYNPYVDGWTKENEMNWRDQENWLLQQYEGKSVADILDIKVYYDENGEPYKLTSSEGDALNPELAASGLLITSSTQGSGRLLLAVQDALNNK